MAFKRETQAKSPSEEKRLYRCLLGFINKRQDGNRNSQVIVMDVVGKQ